MKPVFQTIALALCATGVWAQTQPQPGWRKFDGPGSAPPQQGSAPQYGQFPAPPPPPAQITLPAGSWISIRVNEPLSSDHSQQGQLFTASLAQPLIAQGFVIARVGQTLSGRVAEALKAGRVKGTSSLSIELADMTMADGQHLPIKTELVSHSGPTSVGQDAAAIGTTTGLGAAIGAAADGGFGAGMGAIAGAGASIIGVLVTRGHPTIISPEDTLTFRITEPITISTENAPHAFLPAVQQDYEQPRMLQQRPAFARGPVYGAPYPYYGPWGYPYPYPYFYGPTVGVGFVIHGHHH
jgi:hypothetical protein